jgi:hypothetical protein
VLISNAWGVVWGGQNQQSVKDIAWYVSVSQRSPQRAQTAKWLNRLGPHFGPAL